MPTLLCESCDAEIEHADMPMGANGTRRCSGCSESHTVKTSCPDCGSNELESAPVMPIAGGPNATCADCSLEHGLGVRT